MRDVQSLQEPELQIGLDRPAPDTVVITVAGAIDIATTPALRARLDEAISPLPESLTVDLTEVTFMDSTGLAALVHASRRLQVPDQLLVVLRADSYVGVILDATGLSRCLNVVTVRD